MFIGTRIGIPASGGPKFDPLSLFAGGKRGFLYDNLGLGGGYTFKDTSLTIPVTADGDLVAGLKDRSPNGKNATQSTSGSRPVWKANGGKPYLSPDGIDDVLLSSLMPSSVGMTMAACFLGTTANTLVMGASGGPTSNRCYLGITPTTGNLGAGWGAQNSGTINGGSSILNTSVVGLFRANASTVELWLNGVRVYSAPPSGSPTTSVAMALLASNSAGTLGLFFVGRLFRAVAIQDYIADMALLPLMRSLGAGVVSF